MTDAGESYELKEQIGFGGMGVVYRAFDKERGVDVALKTFRTAKPGQVYRLKKEFRALAALRHPNIVELYELTAEDDGQCFYTMELIEGVDPLHYCSLEPIESPCVRP